MPGREQPRWKRPAAKWLLMLNRLLVRARSRGLPGTTALGKLFFQKFFRNQLRCDHADTEIARQSPTASRQGKSPDQSLPEGQTFGRDQPSAGGGGAEQIRFRRHPERRKLYDRKATAKSISRLK